MGKTIKEVLDTNVVLRFLVGDDKVQQQKAHLWFKEAEEGKRNIVIKPLVIAEACFVLESFYHKSREDISNAFEVFLSQKWLAVEDRKVMLSLWVFYRQSMHFVDSFLLSFIKINKAKLLSFDIKLMKKTLR